MEKTVEAVICGHEITSAEVDAFIASLPREQQVYASHPDFRKQCVDQLIAVYALAKYGEEEKLDETEKFKAILENARKDILAQMAIGKIFEGIIISDEEIREYFEANKARFAKGASVHAKHILVDSEDKCNKLLESIVSGGKALRMLQKNLLPARQEQTVETLANSEKDRWSKNSKMPHLQQKSDMWLDRSRHSLDTI